MIDTPAVFSLVRCSGQPDLMQLFINLHGEDGLQYAIFTFVPSCETLNHSMSSTVSLENMSRNVCPRSRFCPAREDRPKIRRGRRTKTKLHHVLICNYSALCYSVSCLDIHHLYQPSDSVFVSVKFTFMTFRFRTVDVIFSPISSFSEV